LKGSRNLNYLFLRMLMPINLTFFIEKSINFKISSITEMTNLKLWPKKRIRSDKLLRLRS